MTLSWAPTLTTVVPAFVITGSPTCGITSPVFSLTVYVVVVTLEPFVPASVTFSEPTGFVLSPVYVTVGSITSVTTLGSTFL